MSKNKGYYFLASPFQGNVEEKSKRYALSKQIAAAFLEQYISVFAPILYNQAIIDFFPVMEWEDRRKLLMPMNMNFLLNSQGMILLKLEGWDVSWGIKQYLTVCEKENIKIYDLYPDNIDSRVCVLGKILI